MSTFQPGEISSMLDIPPSTLRRYVSIFGDYLSADANKKRGRRFTQNDVAILARIRDLAAQGQRLEDLAPQLVDLVDHAPPVDTDRLALQVVNNRLDSIADMFKDQQSDLNDLRRKVDALTGQLEVERRRSIWSRLFGKK